MKNRRYALLLMDSTGRSIRRIGVSRRSLELAIAALAISLLVGVGMLIHGVVRYDAAAEAQAIRSENAELQAMLARLESQIPALRHALGRSERSFAQLWSRSGLGVEPRLLGAGPHEAGDGQPGGPIDEPLAAPVNGDLLDLDPVALPFEAERIRNDGRALQHSLAEVQEYFNDAQRLLSHTPSIRPTPTPWLTSSFGKRRDPMNGTWVMHKGLDLGGHVGKEIVAPADGVVIFIGRRGGYGQTVVIDHGYGLQTHYAHLSKYRVTRGQRVGRGELIAEMGSTGKSTGPHLHYEVRRLGNPLDPRRFILDWSPTSRAERN
jgi:murein DD-endopeptidase MepM/ murein hydrolase activator NlpD